MGLWIKDSELEVFRIDGIDARFYLKRLSRGAMLKAQEIASRDALKLVTREHRNDPRETRKLQAEQQAQHDAKPLDERLAAELDTAYETHDRATILAFGLPKVESWEENEDNLEVREGENWLETMDAEACERVFRRLVEVNAILPSRLKG